jgi:hypothetical protein
MTSVDVRWRPWSWVAALHGDVLIPRDVAEHDDRNDQHGDDEDREQRISYRRTSRPTAAMTSSVISTEVPSP